MDYQKAAAIARQHPGAIVTRNASGAFVVCLSDGRVVTSADPVPTGRHGGMQERDLEAIRQQYRALEAELQATRSGCADLGAELTLIRNELEKARAKLAKVSPAEWERIKQEERRIEQDERRKRCEAERDAEQQKLRSAKDQIVALVREGRLSYERLRAVMDASDRYGLSDDEMKEIRQAYERQKERVSSPLHGLAVHAPTDGQ